MTRTAEVRVSNSDELDSFIEAEKERKTKISDKIMSTSANFVVCGGRSIETYS